jgi:hypothetical protein
MLIDENLPLKFKEDFGDKHEVFSARDMNWQGKKNGELLGLMIEAGFDGFVTMDKNLPHQQNLTKFPMTIFVLRGSDNKLETLQELVPILLSKIEIVTGRGVIEIRK